MFEYLYTYFELPGFFRLFSYVSFRALLASLFAMSLSFIFGDYFIGCLRRLSLKERIRDDGPSSHSNKEGTPTMGGLLILGTSTFACLLFGNFSNFHFILLLLFTLLFGAIGFWDDYIKIVLKNKRGLNAKLKLFLTILLSLSFCSLYYHFTSRPAISSQSISYSTTSLFLPFFKGELWSMPLFIAFFFWLLVLVGSAHAVNLSDGLDGLAIGNVSIVAMSMGILAYLTGTPLAANYLRLPLVEGAHEVSIFLAALTGAGIGFLWFNAAPARIFMGDTGSIALGSALGMTAVIIKKEILLAIAGGIFVLEALSVILQVLSYKLRGKRIFKMSPIHHHFELSGWPETRVVIRFWLIGIILSLLAFSTLRVQ